jgi:hypothetical protein
MDMMTKLSKEIQNEDLLIRVRPFADNDGKWSGEVDISIMAMPDNPLDDDDYYQIMHFAKMMYDVCCSTCHGRGRGTTQYCSRICHESY